MIILDENVPESQRLLLLRWRIPIRQIGHGIGRAGLKDKEIIVLLHRLNRPTFFTLDEDFYDQKLSHEGYCLVYLDVEEEVVAEHVRRFLRHRAFNSKAKRMGLVVRALRGDLVVWRIYEEMETRMPWISAKKN